MFLLSKRTLNSGKLVFNLDCDPLPDLALEIDITHKSLNRFPIYARLGVLEIWCYDSGELKIYLLEQGDYREKANSLVFPNINIQAIPKLIETYRPLVRRHFRKAVRE